MARYQKNVYCEIEFLRFLSEEESKTFPFDMCHFLELISTLKQLLSSKNIMLYLDISLSDYYQLIDDIDAKRGEALSRFEQLLRSIEDQRGTINNVQLKGSDFPNLEKGLNNDAKELDGIYLTCKSNKVCMQSMLDYGIIAICPENLKEYISILHDQGYAIHKASTFSWTKMLQTKKSPCNSMIIVDNYVICDTQKLDNNIKCILDSLLPYKMKYPFYLTILTESTKEDSELRHQKIEEILALIRPDLEIIYSTVKCVPKTFHDRTIITNNIWISCGGGFDLFNKYKKSDKLTNVNIIYPYLNKNIQWTSVAYSNLWINVRDVYSKANKFTFESGTPFYLGTKEHRLLNYSS